MQALDGGGWGKLTRAPCFSADGRVLYLPAGASVQLTAVSTGAPLGALVGHAAPVTGVALHPTHPRQVLTTSLDGTLRTWSLERAEAAAPPLRVSDWPVSTVAVDPATGFAWAGSEDGGVVVIRWVGGVMSVGV